MMQLEASFDIAVRPTRVAEIVAKRIFSFCGFGSTFD
jgi:hypothetical protein